MAGQQGIRAGRAYVELGVQDMLAAGLKRASRRLRAFGAGVREIGARLARLGVVLAAPFAAGAKVFADFEQQMANVSTMLDEPEAHMDRFKRAIRVPPGAAFPSRRRCSCWGRLCRSSAADARAWAARHGSAEAA